jgi:hypothetical protein
MKLSESPQLPRGPIVLSFREQIAKKHNEGKEADFALREAILRNLEIKRQTGELIKSARGTLREGEFDTVTDFLDRDTVRSYLKFARQHEEPITDLQAGLRAIAIAMQTTGLLPFAHGHGEQHLHRLNFFSAACSLIQRFSREFSKFIRSKPLKSWRAETLESFSADLVPLGRIISAVNSELKRRQNPQR